MNGEPNFIFKPAVRQGTQLLVGLSGPSGSGKTRSALRIATGLANGSPIFFLDTESGRALYYADECKFLYAGLTAPFRPERYEAAIQAAVDAKAKVIIVDSMSHEHEGPGGILEWHDAELTRMAGDDFRKREKFNFAAWIKPKAAHNRLVNMLLQVPAHLVLCFRAKDKLELVKTPEGIKPVPVGWTPICADRLDYEMSVMLILPPNSKGCPDLEAKSTKMNDAFAAIFHNGEQLTEAHGEKLRAWAAGAAPAVGFPAPTNGTKKPFVERVRDRLDAARSEDDVHAIANSESVRTALASAPAEVRKRLNAMLADALKGVAPDSPDDPLDGWGDAEGRLGA